MARSRPLPVLLLPVLLLSVVLGCSNSDHGSGPQDGSRAFLGVFANAQGVPGADPLLTKAYADVRQGGFALAQFRLDWGETEARLGVYDWSELDLHELRTRGDQVERTIPLSVEILLIDNQIRGSLPDDLRGQWLDGVNFRVRFARFASDVARRARGRLAYLWIGREVDVYLAAHPEEVQPFLALVQTCRDSLRAVDPGLLVGTSFAYAEAREGGWLGVVDPLLPALDRVGLTIFGRNRNYVQTLDPDETLALVREGVEAFADRRVVVLATGYPRGASPTDPQETFARGLTAYLDDPPENLDGVIWDPLYDYAPEVAAQIADRLYGGEPDRSAAYQEQLRSLGIKDVGGNLTGTSIFLWSWLQGGSSRSATTAP